MGSAHGMPICTSGKRPFLTRQQAEHHLDWVRDKRANDPDRQQRGRPNECLVYECPVCHLFHLTSVTKRMRRSDYTYKHPRQGSRRRR